MKAEILLQTFISQGDPQAVYENSDIYIKVFYYLKTLLRFLYCSQYGNTAKKLIWLHPININSTVAVLSLKYINEVLPQK